MQQLTILVQIYLLHILKQVNMEYKHLDQVTKYKIFRLLKETLKENKVRYLEETPQEEISNLLSEIS